MHWHVTLLIDSLLELVLMILSIFVCRYRNMYKLRLWPIAESIHFSLENGLCVHCRYYRNPIVYTRLFETAPAKPALEWAFLAYQRRLGKSIETVVIANDKRPRRTFAIVEGL